MRARGTGAILFEFIIANREKLIALTRTTVENRLAPKPTEWELTSSVPLFLDLLAETLRHVPSQASDAIERSAAAHGAAMLDLGYTVAQVVHAYGDVCQAITELAATSDARITAEEFRTLSRCLDNAIAGAVTEYARLRERSRTEGEAERSGVLVHELRNRIASTQLAFTMIQSGRAPINGSVAALINRGLHGMTSLINRAFLEVRLDSGNNQPQRIELHRLIEEAEVDGTLEAGVRGVSLSVAPTDRAIDVEADPQILSGALANLLQNAFKFTREGGHVSLTTSVTDARVHIEIEDECGGLPPGKAQELFRVFQQHSTNRSGLGLGLFISRKAVEASGGVIRVRDLPGRGCVFTIDLPRPARELVG